MRWDTPPLSRIIKLWLQPHATRMGFLSPREISVGLFTSMAILPRPSLPESNAPKLRTVFFKPFCSKVKSQIKWKIAWLWRKSKIFPGIQFVAICDGIFFFQWDCVCYKWRRRIVCCWYFKNNQKEKRWIGKKNVLIKTFFTNYQTVLPTTSNLCDSCYI